MPCQRLRIAVGLSACLMASACAPTTATPDGAVRSVLGELSRHNPRAAWDALPRRYQQDIQGLVREVADRLDRETYHQCVTIGRRFADVARTQRALILEQVDAPAPGMEPFILPLADALSVALDDDLSSLDNLRSLDLGRFASTTGSRMTEAFFGALAADGADPTRRLAELQVNLLTIDGNRAVVQVVDDRSGSCDELEMTNVGGRWIPTELAQLFPSAVARIRAAIDLLPDPEDPEACGLLQARLSRLEDHIEALADATTAEGFHAALKAAVTPAEPR